MSRRLILILAIGAVAIIWGWLDGPAARQRRGMGAARALQVQVESRLASDPRFASVNVGVSTHPALFVRGEVPDEKSLQDLKAMIVLPPDANFRLLLHVKVDESAATRPAH